jgi:hypothetical protein
VSCKGWDTTMAVTVVLTFKLLAKVSMFKIAIFLKKDKGICKIFYEAEERWIFFGKTCIHLLVLLLAVSNLLYEYLSIFCAGVAQEIRVFSPKFCLHLPTDPTARSLFFFLFFFCIHITVGFFQCCDCTVIPCYQ